MLPPQDIHKPQGATFVVAASNSLHKERADYVCGGVDDQVEIQAAIDALPSGGGKLLFIDGQYNCSNNFTINKDNAILEGSGAVLYLADGSDSYLIKVSADNVVVKNFEIDGNKAANPAELDVCSVFSPADNFLYTGNYIHDSNGDGIESRGTNLRVINNLFRDNREDDVHVHNGPAIVTNNVMLDNDVRGVTLSSDSHPPHDIIIANNIISGTVTGIEIGGYWGRPMDPPYNVLVESNQIYNNTNGITIRQVLNHIDIKNNQIYSNSGEGIKIIAGTDSAGDKISITNNDIYSNTKDGIEGPGAIVSYFTALTITENRIVANGERGIDMSFSAGFIVSNNYIAWNGEHGLYLRDGSTKGNVINNYVYNNGQAANNTHFGIYQWIASTMEVYNLVFEGNVVISDATNKHKYSFLISGGGASGHYNEISIRNNILRGAATKEMSLCNYLVNEVVESNIGYVTKNSGTSTGTGAQQNIAHGLGATPTKVILWNIEDGANPYQSAAADGTNIKITAVINQDWGWEAEVT